MAKRATIRHVAQKAEVSTATVSHVLNDTRYVTDETRTRVLEAVRELHYYPSAVARGLVTQKTRTVGVIVPDIANSFFAALFKGIEHELAPLGYDLILENTGANSEKQNHSLQLLFSREVDGIILAPNGHPSTMLQLLQEKGIAIVLVDRSSPDVDLPLVEVNNHQAALDATNHLIADGHRRIGLILGLDTTTERQAGYTKAMKLNGLPVDESLIYRGNSSLENGLKGTKALLSLPIAPTAIFTTNNLMTLGALHALHESGLRCPEDMALIGFDDTDWASIFTPPLTVVQQPTRQIGQSAAKLLHELMSDKDAPSTPMRRTFSAHLMVRGSCSTSCWANYKMRGQETPRNLHLHR